MLRELLLLLVLHTIYCIKFDQKVVPIYLQLQCYMLLNYLSYSLICSGRTKTRNLEMYSVPKSVDSLRRNSFKQNIHWMKRGEFYWWDWYYRIENFSFCMKLRWPLLYWNILQFINLSLLFTFGLRISYCAFSLMYRVICECDKNWILVTQPI